MDCYKLKLPSILGWLIIGMVAGPHALNLLGNSVLDAKWFEILESILESVFGLMIGTELIWKRMKKAGAQILVTTVTKTLIPMAALDDLVGALIFFLVIAFVSAHISSTGIPIPVVFFLVFLPVLVGIATGFLTGKILEHTKKTRAALPIMLVMLLVSAEIGFAINAMLPVPVLNFMLIGMSYSAVFANMVTEDQLNGMMKVMNPMIGFFMIIVILNLAAPLDYHLIFGAGIYTAVYIIARAVGKYSGAYFGAALTHAPATVKKYLGFTLLPHSGVSLVFTGIVVSVLMKPDPESAKIVQGTVAAAAVINEIIAVFMAKKGFEWAGELHRAGKEAEE